MASGFAQLAHLIGNLLPGRLARLSSVPKTENKARVVQRGAAQARRRYTGLFKEGFNLGFEIRKHHATHNVGFILHCKEDLSHLRTGDACRIIPTWITDR